MSSSAWSTQQLAEFLEVFGAVERSSLLRVAVDRVAESLDAEIAALVIGSEVAYSLGFPANEIPTELILKILDTQPATMEVSGLGFGYVMSTAVDADTDCHLVVIRSSSAYSREEATLLRSMGRALALAMANSELLGQLSERQELAERLFRIQQSISHRAPLQLVLDAVTQGAAELLNADIVGLHITQDQVDGYSMTSMTSMSGVTQQQRMLFAATPVRAGFSGRAFLENRIVVTNDYQSEPERIDRGGKFTSHGAMAAPVHRGDEPVGVISVAVTDTERRFTAAEQEVLLSFAQQVSLAVNDANIVHQLRSSLDSATYLSTHDPLTGLANRTSILQLLEKALVKASPESAVAVLFIDVDRFKNINDVLGHAVGDQVLIELADRLRSTVRATDVAARLGGDEFVVVARDISIKEAEELANRITEVMAQPATAGTREVSLSVSVGVSVATAVVSADDLLTDADLAMYRAKQHGRARVVHFDAEMRDEILHAAELEEDLLVALRDGDQLQVFYQPIMLLGSAQVDGFEALIRWNHPTRGLLGAEEFVPLIEKIGHIGQIDQFVLREATLQLSRWQALAPAHHTLSMAVNLSAWSFSDPDLVSIVEEVVRDSAIAPQNLHLEITETIMMDQTGRVALTLEGLRNTGIRLAVDDFGTGYSSLLYLKQFAVDALKIDREFVVGLGVDEQATAIVAAIVQLAKALGLSVVAEGIETQVQLDCLRGLGCAIGQGYLFARPVPADAAEKFLIQSAFSADR
ncbi:MAG: bifunctional diguanylate cyclase/phosphodiesterase [Microthrixaceae bacterium]